VTPVTVITGASAGIGTELARVFADNGHALVLVARRESRLDALADEIAARGRPKPLVLPIDLSMPHAAAWIARALAVRSLEPQYIVNNAGFGLVGRAADLDHDEQLAMIDLNMRALADLSLSFVESLGRHRGGLLNVASVAGFLPCPGSAVYYASKAFVLSFSEALHVELGPLGIKVTCLCPGPVSTEFQARAGIAEARPARLLALPAHEVAAEGYRGLMEGRRVVVPGRGNRLLASLVPRLVPRALLLQQLDARQLRRRVKQQGRDG
jgi:short-subunit dehydrogenase